MSRYLYIFSLYNMYLNIHSVFEHMLSGGVVLLSNCLTEFQLGSIWFACLLFVYMCIEYCG